MPRSWFRSALLAALPQAVRSQPSLSAGLSATLLARRRTRSLSVETLETRHLLAADSMLGLFCTSPIATPPPTSILSSPLVGISSLSSLPVTSAPIPYLPPPSDPPVTSPPIPYLPPPSGPPVTSPPTPSLPPPSGPPITSPPTIPPPSIGTPPPTTSPTKPPPTPPPQLALEVVDAHTKKPAIEVLEGATVAVTVTLSGGYRPPNTFVTVTADVNFDGQIQPGDLSPERGVLKTPGMDGRYRYTFSLPDDGPWPGNGTPRDKLTIRAAYGSVEQTFDVLINNLPPRFIAPPVFSLGTDAAGQSVARVTVKLTDIGRVDTHTASVKWSDDKVTSTRDFADLDSSCGPDGGRIATVERKLEAGERVYPVEVRIADDDHPADGDNAGLSSFKMSRLDLALNDDDDNQSGEPDLAEVLVSGEDDLREVDLAPLLSPEMTVEDGEFYFSYDAGYIRVWDSADKRNLIPPRLIGPEGMGTSNTSGTPTIDYSGQETVFVEGVSGGRSLITLSWRSNTPFTSSPVPGCPPAASIIFGGSIDVSVWTIDLDIDSDNNGIINHSEWEEELENHEFSLGKLLYWQKPNELPKFDDVEMRLLLPKGLDPGLTVTLAGKRNEGVSSGNIDVLDYKHQLLGRTEFTGPIGTFTLSRLGYSAGTGQIKLFIKQPLTVNSPRTYTAAAVQGKPDNRIEAIVNLSNGFQVSDEVKVLIVRRMDFFDSVNTLQYLRNAGASQAVYSGGSGADGVMRLADGKNFAMRYIEADEMEDFIEKDTFGGMSEELKTLAKSYIRSYLYNSRPLPYPEKPVSFQAGLYRDYVTGNYVLAYRGTEMGTAGQQIPDWIVNISQGLVGDDGSYEAGVLLAWALKSMDFTKVKLFKLTGHSLGGGLASAASTVNGIPADVFNGAGVHPLSLVQDDGSPIIPNGLMPDLSRAKGLISHFYVPFVDDGSIAGDTIWNAPDILTFLSLHVAAMPNPVGHMIEIEGLHNLRYADRVSKGIQELQKLPATPAEILALPTRQLARLAFYFVADSGVMVGSHGLDSVFFGLLHNDNAGNYYWNAYDESDSRAR